MLIELPDFELLLADRQAALPTAEITKDESVLLQLKSFFFVRG